MRALVTIFSILLLAGAVGGGILLSGFLSPAANNAHAGAVYQAINFVVEASISRSAADIEPPDDLESEQRIQKGMKIFQDRCTGCHGGPGIAPQPYALGMSPAPPSLMQAARDRPANEIFWITKNGIRTSGMPSWDLKLSDETIWDVAAAIKGLRHLSPQDYYEMVGIEAPQAETSAASGNDAVEGDAQRGKIAIKQFGCTSCHQVTGVPGPDIWVGPPLRGFAQERFIAGVLPNTPQNMVRWIMKPQQVDPLTAMPAVGIDRQSAEDIAAYLASLSG